jgi:hypothetical protein
VDYFSRIELGVSFGDGASTGAGTALVTGFHQSLAFGFKNIIFDAESLRKFLGVCTCVWLLRNTSPSVSKHSHSLAK